jgi:transcriptional regulator with XRE-family HTH domain
MKGAEDMLRIKEIRKAKNVSAKQIAKYANVAESTMSLYENGKREPDYETLIRIADYLSVSLDRLFGRTGYEFELSDLEAAVLSKYRNTPEMQKSVETLLNVDADDFVNAYTAAYSDDNDSDDYVPLTSEEIDALKNAPVTDETFI